MTGRRATGVPAAAQPAPQAVLSASVSHALFLVVTVDEGGEARVRHLLTKLAGLVRATGSRAPEGHLSCVAAVGSDAWDRLFAGPRPARLHTLREIEGRRRAVSTPGDLLFHIRASRSDLCFELAAELMGFLRRAVTVCDEVVGFKYFGERDLLGFVDGTENPTGEAACAAVLVGDEDAPFACGSYVLVQKYLHDLDGWNALPVEAQERAIGRAKVTNIEQDSGEQAPNSHVALNKVLAPDGTEQRILRCNMPFGSAARGEFGTYFIGYARSPVVIEQMLRNMFLGKGPSGHDRILDFSAPVTGTLFFAPSATFFDGLPEPPDAGSDSASLRIGSLRRSPSV
ncbi:Dyp-type peroxidase [Streptomyces sp. NPDC093675]|uniref:Dyp-type peroxidase n=1 Tax=Streptomyces sp. NPDC093675 TaxID=3366049 RepID=UPI0037F37AC3